MCFQFTQRKAGTGGGPESLAGVDIEGSSLQADSSDLCPTTVWMTLGLGLFVNLIFFICKTSTATIMSIS